MLEKAIALHQKGQAAEAEQLYRKVLAKNPKNADALHLLGVIEAQRKNLAAAAELIGRATQIHPSNAIFWSNHGNVLQELRRLDEALASYDRALAIKPDHAEALWNRGNVLKDLRRPDESLASYDRALTIRPRYADALYSRGALLQNLGRLDAALISYDGALAIKPDHAEAFYNRGTTLQELGRPGDALVSYARALAIRPAFAEALLNQGNALQELGRPGDALVSFARALAIRPDYAEALVNRGNALQELRRLGEALASYDRALAIAPDFAAALFNRGNALKELGQIDKAFASYDRALAARPDYAEAFKNRADCHLLSGHYKKGWEDYEWRWQTKEFLSRRPALDAPIWQGEDLAERSIFVFSEQGLGDALQFTRFLPLLAARGAKVTFGAPANMIRLLQPLSADIEILGALEPGKNYDFQCALMSLPRWLGTDLDTIPAPIAFAEPDAALAARWKQHIGDQGLRIGIVWQGNPAGKIDQGRSFPLSELAPLARIAGVRLISLQKRHGLEQLAHLPTDMTVESLGDDFDSGPDAFLDSAAVMRHLDLVITADTSIAHLAGTLGCPTWVALKHVPDWRWLLGRDDSPWYPSLRLFRQDSDGDWKSVFSRMEKALRALLVSRDSAPEKAAQKIS